MAMAGRDAALVATTEDASPWSRSLSDDEKALIESVLDVIPVRYADVLREYSSGLTQVQMAERVGVSQVSISQRLIKARSAAAVGGRLLQLIPPERSEWGRDLRRLIDWRPAADSLTLYLEMWNTYHVSRVVGCTQARTYGRLMSARRRLLTDGSDEAVRYVMAMQAIGIGSQAIWPEWGLFPSGEKSPHFKKIKKPRKSAKFR